MLQWSSRCDGGRIRAGCTPIGSSNHFTFFRFQLSTTNETTLSRFNGGLSTIQSRRLLYYLYLQSSMGRDYGEPSSWLHCIRSSRHRCSSVQSQVEGATPRFAPETRTRNTC